jgi:hypothetical protein
VGRLSGQRDSGQAEAGGTLRVLQPDARDPLLEATREVNAERAVFVVAPPKR